MPTQVCTHPDVILNNATIKTLIGSKCDGVIGQVRTGAPPTHDLPAACFPPAARVSDGVQPTEAALNWRALSLERACLPGAPFRNGNFCRGEGARVLTLFPPPRS